MTKTATLIFVLGLVSLLTATGCGSKTDAPASGDTSEGDLPRQQGGAGAAARMPPVDILRKDGVDVFEMDLGRGVSSEQAFAHLDTNSDGNLAGEEIDPSLKERMEEVDTNKDGEVSADEFNTALAELFQERSNARRRGGRRGGRGGFGGPQQPDTRPDRPDRPALDDGIQANTSDTENDSEDTTGKSSESDSN